jgi:hypothetical protein
MSSSGSTPPIALAGVGYKLAMAVSQPILPKPRSNALASLLLRMG